jgi:hypothetical protein
VCVASGRYQWDGCATTRPITGRHPVLLCRFTLERRRPSSDLSERIGTDATTRPTAPTNARMTMIIQVTMVMRALPSVPTANRGFARVHRVTLRPSRFQQLTGMSRSISSFAGDLWRQAQHGFGALKPFRRLVFENARGQARIFLRSRWRCPPGCTTVTPMRCRQARGAAIERAAHGELAPHKRCGKAA